MELMQQHADGLPRVGGSEAGAYQLRQRFVNTVLNPSKVRRNFTQGRAETSLL